MNIRDANRDWRDANVLLSVYLAVYAEETDDFPVIMHACSWRGLAWQLGCCPACLPLTPPLGVGVQPPGCSMLTMNARIDCICAK